MEKNNLENFNIEGTQSKSDSLWAIFWFVIMIDSFAKLFLDFRVYIFNISPFMEFELFNVRCLLLDTALVFLVNLLYFKRIFKSFNRDFSYLLIPISTLLFGYLSFSFRTGILQSTLNDTYGYAFYTFSWSLGRDNFSLFYSLLSMPYFYAGILISAIMLIYGVFRFSKCSILGFHEKDNKLIKPILISLAILILALAIAVFNYLLKGEPSYHYG